jgi:hypothetical protein
MKENMKESPKILGLDVSSKTIGIALFDINSKELLEIAKAALAEAGCIPTVKASLLVAPWHLTRARPRSEAARMMTAR